ncbi:MAG: glycosyltransferase family 4 protein [Bacteroidales bacterium]|nr:glycosyltransferase family 4 protein [Bacteroidales bacterium]MCF8344065.1 glycosyltransferase family 4 protein [Bacteroidales bacterium]MCF8352604.1 glycosyltransferase family 4 protein [Bacteroidales bacterium]MCF8374825.1 glycosyltransferase family 4 protein [Bacteroidales bacterium]MCF8399771.1 glycosyltransferase family 4 protein [Bacteroidales bacterium]
MKILLICNKSPCPPREGGPIAMSAIINGLIKANCQVKVLAINSNKYQVSPSEIPEEFRKKTAIEFGYIDLGIKPVKAFLNLFTGNSYHVERFINENFRKKLEQILEEDHYDIIQLETLFMSPYLDTIRKHSSAKIVLRAHNIEHLIWQRVANASRNPLKKFYLNHLSKTLKNYELSILNSFDGIATITSKDANFLKKHTGTPIRDISFGIDPEDLPGPKNNYEFPSLFHIGSMNWIPNIEGIRWFLNNVWESVHEQHPDLKFYLAGREMPEWLYHTGLPNIEVLGEVDDALDFIRSKGIMIVPLLSGSGIRIKIIEGMAMGKAIISTRIGAEGIKCRHAEHILFAEKPEEYLEAISKCVESREYSEKLGQNARKLIFEKHNNKKIIERLIGFYQEIL